MPFTAGVFALYTPGNPVVTATTIQSSWAKNTLSDIATALSSCVLKDGTQTITANLPMAGFKLTGLAAATTAGDALRYEQLFTTNALTLLGEIRYTAGAALTASGSSQSDAFQLTAAINQVTTTASGAGVKLYASPSAGSWQLVYNGGANPMKVYPQTSGTINGLAANAGMTLPINTSCMFFAATATAWIGVLSY